MYSNGETAFAPAGAGYEAVTMTTDGTTAVATTARARIITVLNTGSTAIFVKVGSGAPFYVPGTTQRTFDFRANGANVALSGITVKGAGATGIYIDAQ